MNVQMTQGASRYTKALAIGVSAIAVGMAMPAAAQDDTGTESAQQGRNTVFGEIVVTATKREEQV